MKKTMLFLAGLLIISGVMAQDKNKLPDPFKGGAAAMAQFFKDSILVTPAIVSQKATGLVIFKFTADQKGNLQKIVVYYADDLILTEPIIAALAKTKGKWVIPENYKFYDFVIPFSVNYTPSAQGKAQAQKTMYNFYQQRKPVLATDQVPLNAATLLPVVVINY